MLKIQIKFFRKFSINKYFKYKLAEFQFHMVEITNFLYIIKNMLMQIVQTLCLV